MNGKGDVPRPLFVSRKTFEAHWDLAFGSKQRNVPSPLPLRKIDVPLIEGELQPLCEHLNFDSLLGEMYGKFRKNQENNRELMESDNTEEASDSTIQTPS